MTRDTERVKLVVFMEPEEKDTFEESGTFCCKRESTAPIILRFCKGTGSLPYSVEFVSIAVLRSDENPCDSGAAIYGLEDSLSVSSLHYAVLKQTPEVLADIALVGDDDLKQILTLVSTRWENKEQYASVMGRVQDLRAFLPERKPSEMLRWTYHRGQHDYSEARLNRCLNWREVAEWGSCDSCVEGGPESRSRGDDIADYFE
jgi:hypothetical protein